MNQKVNFTVNDKIEFDAAIFDDVNALQLDEHGYVLIYKNKKYDIHFIKKDDQTQKYHLKIDGTEVQVAASSALDLLVNRLGFNKPNTASLKEVKAPMPGLVLHLLVKEGDQVSAGDNLLILEAMKMENIIKSPVDGTIESCKISKGAKVEKNQILLKFQ